MPLRSKCAESVAQGPPGQESVITTLTGFPEHEGFSVHFTCSLQIMLLLIRQHCHINLSLCLKDLIKLR